VGIFKEKYSEATEEEYRLAVQQDKDILIYVGEAAETLDDRLQKLLDEIKNRHSYQKFEDVSQLQSLFRRDVLNLLKRHYKISNESSHFHRRTGILSDDKKLREYIGKVMGSADPSSLQDFLRDLNPVASEIIAVWNAMGYEMKNFEVLDDMIDFEGEISRWPRDNVMVRCVAGEVTSLHVDDMHRKMEKKAGTRGFIFTFSRILASARMAAMKYPHLKVMTQAEFYNSLLNPQK